MALAERKDVDYYIKEYLLINTRIKIAKVKIAHAEYRCDNATIARNRARIEKLNNFKRIVDTNVKNEYVEKFEIFRVSLSEAMEMLTLSKSSITKLKRKIREEFAKVIEIIEAE